MSKKPVYVIAISGPSGSGKSSMIAEVRKRHDKNDIKYLQMDHYYLDHSHLSLEERGGLNYDSPTAFDVPLLTSHIKELKNNKTIQMPNYDFSTHSRTDILTPLEPGKVIILDGILLMAVPEVRSLIDHAVFLNTPIDLCLLRRLTRDCLERDRSVSCVVKQYEATVRPMLFKHILPSKQYADTVLPLGGFDDEAIHHMDNIIQHFLDK